MIDHKLSPRLTERWRNAVGLVIGLLLSAVLLFVADWEADRQERERMDTFRGDIVDIARISEAIIADRLREYDNILLVLRDSYSGDLKRFSEKVLLLRSGPLADREILVVLVDREGNLTYTDTPNVKPGLYRGDQPYFKYFAEGGKDTFYVSEPVFGRVTGRYSIPLVRPIYNKQGGFLGVVALSVRQDSLASFGPRLQLSGETTVNVITHDGAVASRSRDLAKLQGTKIKQELLAPMLKADEGVFSSHAFTDGIEQVIAYRHIQGTPLIVYVEDSP